MIRSAIFAALLFAGSNLWATTSYLMIESPFGSSTTPTTFEFAVQYSGSQLLTGTQLTEAVFGAPNLSTTGGVALNNHNYFSTNTIGGVQYAAEYSYSSSFGYFMSSFSVGGQQGGVSGNPDPSFFWGYFNAGGGYNDTSGFTDPPVGPYDSGSWSFANTGEDGRTLADQTNMSIPSFDAWVFGDGDDTQFPSVNPTVADFAGATVVNLTGAPEPGRVVLLLTGGVLGLALRRRKSWFG